MTFFSSLLIGCLPHSPSLPSSLTGAVELPVYRSSDTGERLFVAVTLPEVGKQYFMVDTGASVSAIRSDLVEEMQLYVKRKNGYLSGVSGRVPWIETIVPEIQLGSLTLDKVEFAVSDGLPTQAGLVPLAGILGNNIWSNYVMDIDYGLERILLHTEFEFDDTAQKVSFDGQHILAPVELSFGENRIQTFIANIDTGSSGLILNSLHVPQLLDYAVESRETIMGVGADRGNAHDYVLETQSVEVADITLGGLTKPYPDSAILLTPPQDDFISLVGHQALEDHRVIIGYKDERLQLQPSINDLPVRDIHRDYLQSIQWGNVDADPMTEIQLHFRLQQHNIGVRKLRKLIAQDDKPQYRVALAFYHFQRGDLDSALREIEELDLIELRNMGIHQTLILSYIYTGEIERAEMVLEEELEHAPNNIDLLWTLSMSHLLKGDVRSAKEALYEAEQHGNPNNFLVHKALLKARSDDLTGSIAALRLDVQRNPLGSPSLWFLAQQAKGTEFESIARSTIQHHLSLQNSRRGSLDFLAAALWELGDIELAKRIANQGKARDCQGEDKASRLNCEAWYDALTHTDLNIHIPIMESIVRKNPGRSDYADTLSVLYRANGQTEQAISMSKQAMIFGGSDPYMIWQALRDDQ